jgi:hypothetical protein
LTLSLQWCRVLYMNDTTTKHQNDDPLPEVRDALCFAILSTGRLLDVLIAGDPEHAGEYNVAKQALAVVDLNIGPFEE